jgi:hypothetical protein
MVIQYVHLGCAAKTPIAEFVAASCMPMGRERLEYFIAEMTRHTLPDILQVAVWGNIHRKGLMETPQVYASKYIVSATTR